VTHISDSIPINALIAEPLGLATQEKMDFGLIFATSTNNFLSYNIGHQKKIGKQVGKDTNK
jgi:hypothetical protein